MARSCFDDVLKVDADNLDARLQVGILEYKAHNWAQAEKYLRGVLAISPASVDALYYVGMIELNNGRVDDALREFTELRSRISTDARIFYGLGLVYAKKTDTQRAIEAFAKAIEIDPKCLDAHWELGKIYESVGYKDMAYKEFKAILTAEPNHPLKDVISTKMKLLRDQGVQDNDVRKY
jgi:tetratricopeptide (TPR) repeat protein